MDYDQAVTEGRTLLGRSEHDQWALARLTHRVVVVHRKSMAQWARDLGVSLSHVSNLRNVWAKFGDLYDRKALTNQSFNECYVLARASHERAERLEREAGETGRSAGTIDRASPERERDDVRRRDDFHRRLRDSRALKEAARDPETRERLREFFEEEFPEVRRPHPEPEPEPERAPASAPVREVLRDLAGARDRFYRGIGLLTRAKLSRAQRAEVKRVTDDIENGVDWVNSFLDTGDTSFTEALEAFTREGGTLVQLPETDEPRTRRRPPANPVLVPDAEPAVAGREASRERPTRERREPRIRNGPRRRDRAPGG